MVDLRCRPMRCRPLCLGIGGIGTGEQGRAGARSAPIEIVIGAVMVRVPGGAEARDVEAVLRAVRRSNA